MLWISLSLKDVLPECDTYIVSCFDTQVFDPTLFQFTRLRGFYIQFGCFRPMSPKHRRLMADLSLYAIIVHRHRGLVVHATFLS